ncbi:MerR family transcriptional regulator [Streptomyces sp. NPDC092296]|uniref:MerR family transcriptional regulator n=1 Tax=Streptomyces sp. NPDC092296 TaxID=3366012 RepID=UPI00382F85B7
MDPHPDGDRLLSIGEFARRSRLSLKALRLYDRLGLLVPARVDVGSGYRSYRESQLAVARLVMLLRRLDMPLAQVAQVVALPGREAAGQVAAYWDGVERRIASQRELAVHLRITLSGDERSLGMFDVQEREVPEQLVLTEQRAARPEELPGWIPAATRRLEEAARRYGGVVAAPFVIFHGEVNEDSDGPVETCVPVDADLVPAAERAAVPGLRREAAHREAYVRLTRAQVEYPQILSAYDALEQWIGAQGRRCTGSPREVYFADWGTTLPGDQVCDVAFPIE